MWPPNQAASLCAKNKTLPVPELKGVARALIRNEGESREF